MPTRELRLESLDDAIAEIERLRDEGYAPTGKWNLSQICEHLTATMRMGLDGDQRRMPWIVRKTLGAWMIGSWLKNRRMRGGLPTLDRLLPNGAKEGRSPSEDDPAAIERCLEALREVRDFDGTLPPHSMCDGIDRATYREMCVIHAQHHLAYLKPTARDVAARSAGS